jgi:benzil reductase ((S)-benzoin forming)
MNYYFITGTSRGIGKALAELLLENKDNFVYGISRTLKINHSNYKHFKLDLGNLEEVKNFEFPEFKNAGLIALVNNSAYAGEIVHFGKRTSDDIIESYNVNIVAPAILMNNFLKKYQSENCKRIILNISSGAAKTALESWSTYCSSKSALAMLGEVIDIEQKLKFHDNPVRIFSVGPGVVDTEMQGQLRKTSPENFSMVHKFIEFKEKNQLADPNDIAKKLVQIINFPGKFEKPELHVKDI